MLGKQRVMMHLAGKPVDSLPFMAITMMFAADHVGVPYGQYASDYRVLVDAQMAVAEAYDLDYVSVISDPAREAADLGAVIRYYPDQPPAIDEEQALLADKAVLLQLKPLDPYAGARCTDRLRGVAAFKQQVGDERLIEGWVEGPVAEAADLRGLNRLMYDFTDDPAFAQDLMAYVVDNELRFAEAQLRAGADIIGIGDAAASLLGPRVYNKYAWAMERRLVDGIHALGGIVRLHICGNTSKILEAIGRLGSDIVDLDYLSSLEAGRAAMGPDQILLGNLDPVRALQDSMPDAITAAISRCHREAGPRYIVGAGCEVPRATPANNMHALRDYARSHRPEDV